MKTKSMSGLMALQMALLVAGGAAGDGGSQGWRAIATTRDEIPGGGGTAFSSFNPPAVNRQGTVVFRGRGHGPGEPLRGIFIRRMGADGQPGLLLAARGTTVPDPNNTSTPPDSGELATFLEFPSIPRIAADSEFVASRAQSQPVWTSVLSDGSEERLGTAGVYAWRVNGEATNGGASAFTQLGAVTDDAGGAVFPEFSIPGLDVPARFDQFPGAPAVADDGVVVTKANWSDPDSGLARTGVFFRDLRDNGSGAAGRIASSGQTVPGTDPKAGVVFGSTASPSAAAGKVVFLALDSEELPTAGGIYLAPLAHDPELEPLVGIGSQVPGEEEGMGFRRIGEALAFDGRWVGFWGAWGDETREIVLTCPEDGNPDLIAYCHEQHPAGFVTEVPVHQGVFVHDTATGTTHAVAKTGPEAGDILDFIEWHFAGRVPGTGGHGGEGTPAEEEEFARWRGAAFVAAAGAPGNGGGYRAAFKADRGGTDVIGYAEGPDGGDAYDLLAVGMPANVLDPDAVEGAVISALAIEREAVRDGWMVVGASTFDEATGESLAGVFLAGRRTSGSDFNGDGRADVFWHNDGSQRAAAWIMQGLSRESGSETSIRPRDGYLPVGTGDFDGDRRGEILWREPRTGAMEFWSMDGYSVTAQLDIEATAGPEWKVLAIADLDGDRRSDLVFRNGATGEVRAWRLDGPVKLEGGLVGGAGGLEFLGAGDVDADGRADLAWRSASGVVRVWRMAGLAIVEDAIVAGTGTVPSDWRVEAMGDVDGDGRADLVWRHASRGELRAWFMDGASRRATRVLHAGVPLEWEVADLLDLDGDGRGDLLWRHAPTGDVHGWILDATGRVDGGFIRRATQPWRNIR